MRLSGGWGAAPAPEDGTHPQPADLLTWHIWWRGNKTSQHQRRRQQPATSNHLAAQAPGRACCTGRLADVCLCLSTTKPICRPVLFVPFLLLHIQISPFRPLNLGNPQLISSCLRCAVLCCVLCPLSRLTRPSPAPPFVLYEYICSNEPRSNTASSASSALAFQCK